MKRYLSNTGSFSGSQPQPEVAHEFDTSQQLTNSTARLAGFKNAGVEKASIDKDGNIDCGLVNGVDITALSPVDSLTQNHILVGNASNVPADVAMSGEASIVSSGAVTLANSAVIGKVLTGYVSGAGTVAATDTILQAANKLNGNAAAISTVANAALPSASFTAAAVTGKLLTGYSSGAGTVAASDTILQGINKLNGNVALKAGFPVSTTVDVATTLTGLTSTSFANLTGWVVNFTTTRVNEEIEFNLSLFASMTTITGPTFYLATKFDADAAIAVGFMTAIGANQGGLIGPCSYKTVIATPGAHSIQMQYKVDSLGVATVWGTASAVSAAKIQVTQY